MKNSTKKSLKASNGITLIALVITIIVLLILAGISISMLSGDNSILQKATDAKTNTDNAQIKERVQLAYLAALTGGNGSLTEDTFKQELIKEFGASKITGDTIETSIDGKTWTVTIDGVCLDVLAGKTAETLDLTKNRWRILSDTENSFGQTSYIFNNDGTYNCIGGEFNGTYVFDGTILEIETPWYTEKYIYNDSNSAFEIQENDYPKELIQTNLTEIQFTIDGNRYNAKDGMTWEEWVNSSNYNTDGFYLINNTVFNIDGHSVLNYFYSTSGSQQFKKDLICQENYGIEQDGGR